MWRSDKYALGVAWLGGTSSIWAEVLHRSVGRTGAASGIVGRGMERRSFALTWREVYVAYPVTWLGCLHFHRMYGGLIGFCRYILLTAVEKSDGTEKGKRHTLPVTEAQRSGAQWNAPQLHLALKRLVLHTGR